MIIYNKKEKQLINTDIQDGGYFEDFEPTLPDNSAVYVPSFNRTLAYKAGNVELLRLLSTDDRQSALANYDVYDIAIYEHSSVSLTAYPIKDLSKDPLDENYGKIIVPTGVNVTHYLEQLSDYYNGYYCQIVLYTDPSHCGHYEFDRYLGAIFTSDVPYPETVTSWLKIITTLDDTIDPNPQHWEQKENLKAHTYLTI